MTNPRFQKLQISRIVIIGGGSLARCLLRPLCVQLVSESQANTEIKMIAGDDGEEVAPLIEGLQSEFPSLSISAFRESVMETNVAKLIDDGDVVLSCVNCCNTRKLISDHAGTLKNVTIISGVCDWTSGLVQTYVRQNGVDLSLPLANLYHPEVMNARDGSTDTDSPQSIITSNLVAAVMLVRFDQIRRGTFPHAGTGDYYVDGETGKVVVRERPLARPMLRLWTR
jgi:pyrroline-5-carboxylate reductase